MSCQPDLQCRRTRQRAMAAIGLTFSFVSVPAMAQPGSGLVLEGGAVWQSRNTARIPNSSPASRFSLRDLQGDKASESFRVEAMWEIAERHQVRAVYAPFSVAGTGSPANTLYFNGAEFAAGQPTESRYRFDSYRLGYRYRFHQGDHWTWWGGATLKLRDASIGLRQANVVEEYDNTGVVPLLSILGERRLGGRWSLVLDADGLWAPQGRALDVALKARYALRSRLSLGAGYRTLEGGADNDKVYTFAWQHYAIAEVSWRR